MNIKLKNQQNLYPYLGTTNPYCRVLPNRVVHQISSIFTSNRAPVLNTVQNLTKNGSNLGSEKSFKHLREYKNFLNSQFTNLNNKNNLILSLKNATLSTAVDRSFGSVNSCPSQTTDLTKNWINSEIRAVPNINVLDPINNSPSAKSMPGPAGIYQPGPGRDFPEYAPGKIKNKFSILGINQVYPGAIQGGKNTFHFNMDTTISKHLKTLSPTKGPDLPLKFNSDIATSQYLVYSFNNSSASCSKKNLVPANIVSILKNSFYSMYSIISKPVLDITPNKIIISLFFFLGAGRGRSKTKNKRQIGSSGPKNLKFLSSNHNQLQFLCSNLSKYLKKPVELELIRLYYPYNESQILANTIGLLSKNIRNRFRSLVDKTFNFSKIKNPSILQNRGLLHQKFFGIEAATTKQKNKRISILPSFLTGIKIRLGGRLLSQKVVPRFTVQTFQKGSLARSKANIVTSSRFTHKNKRGTFSITVSVGQGFLGAPSGHRAEEFN